MKKFKKPVIISLVIAIVVVVGISQSAFLEGWLAKYIYPGATETADNDLLEPSVATIAEPSVEMITLQGGPDPIEYTALPQEQTVSAQPLPTNPDAQADNIAEYHMYVKLDADQKRLIGQQTVTWTNPGKKDVQEMYLHLYANAFKSEKTTFMQESGGQLRGDYSTGEIGYINITSLTSDTGDSMLPRLQFVQPDDGNVNDETLAKLQLPTRVEPGEAVTLHMNFEVQLPEAFARMGYKDNFIMAGQWFPKIAAYETQGTRGRVAEGWDMHQYHANSEFYSDFGIYSVKIDVPEEYIVAATGFPTKTAALVNGRKIYNYYADDVHDFAWSASPDFVYFEEAYSDDNVAGTRIKLYLDPNHAAISERYMHAVKSSLQKYSEWYGPYPYSTLSVVVPPPGGNGAGGMEYPTLITAFDGSVADPSLGQLETTVVHEIGHQYWYGMVASNEFEEAWLDEGFATYTEGKLMQSVYGLSGDRTVEASYMTNPEPLALDSWQYTQPSGYVDNVYRRAELVLLGIEKRVGEAKMQRIMQSYFTKFQYKHPSTADFQRVVETVTKQKWTDYFNNFVYGNAVADYAIESVSVEPTQDTSSTEAAKPATTYESTVVIRRTGGVSNAVPIVFRFSDGTEIERSWDGSAELLQFNLTHAAPLDWVAVDPQHTNLLDNKQTNNFMKAKLPEETSVRLNYGVARFVEIVISALAW
jgi:hypothetical protein